MQRIFVLENKQFVSVCAFVIVIQKNGDFNILCFSTDFVQIIAVFQRRLKKDKKKQETIPHSHSLTHTSTHLHSSFSNG